MSEKQRKRQMNLDLQKFFIGLMDFFSILLPGALLTYLLMGEVGPAVLGDHYVNLEGAEGWAAFLFASYLLGHLVFLLGSWLDGIYDWLRDRTLNWQIRHVASTGRVLSWPIRARAFRWCSRASATSRSRSRKSPWPRSRPRTRSTRFSDARPC